MRTILAGLAVLLADSGVVAQSNSRGDAVPDWERFPTREEIAIVWPVAARVSGATGRAVIDCKVSVNGSPFDCSVAEEEPAGLGFGAAAIALTPQMIFKPATKDGRPAIYHGLRVPVNFSMPPPRLSPRDIKDRRGFRPVATDVRWLEGPSVSDVAAAYPTKARAAGVGGQSTLQCDFSSAGRLRNCTVIMHHPSGYGFGAAAMKLAPLFAAPLKFPGGESTKGARVDVRVSFSPELLEPGREQASGWTTLIAAPDADKVREALAVAVGPEDASKAGAVLDCRAAIGGRLEDCRVAAEAPEGRGIGSAAIGLAPDFLLAAWSADGAPVIGARVQVPIHGGGGAH
jgi:TonB family protein